MDRRESDVGRPAPSAPVTGAGRFEPTHLLGLGSADWLVLSPHLDDAVLSCSDLLTGLPAAARARVVTFFTEATPPYTLSARVFARQCRPRVDAPRLYAERRAEDAAAMAELGCSWRHVGLVDALYRKRTRPRPAGRALPELVHLYPTYRWHVARGRVAPGDRAAVAVVKEVLRELPSDRTTVVVAPMGIGSHVDHVLVRDVAARSGRCVVYYADLPYALTGDPDPAFLRAHDLVRVDVPRSAAAKAELVERYGTQARALFPAGIPALPEQLYAPRHLLQLQ